jgi:hypothetical protein
MDQPVDWTLPRTPGPAAQDTGREDLRRIIHGHADFIHDLQPEGLLHGRMLRPRQVRAQLDEAVWAQVAERFAARQMGPKADWPTAL